MLLGIVDGMRDAYEDLQTSHLDLVAHLEASKRELLTNKEETRQLLEAAEQRELQNAANKNRAESLESQLQAMTQDRDRQHVELVQRMERERVQAV